MGRQVSGLSEEKKARGLLTMARHGHAEVLLKLFESLAGLDPDQAIRTLRPHLTEQSKRRESYARSSELASSFSVGACNTRV